MPALKMMQSLYWPPGQSFLAERSELAADPGCIAGSKPEEGALTWSGLEAYLAEFIAHITWYA